MLLGLATESRKDSQGICFLGKLKFDDFVGHHLGEKPGPVTELGTGRLIGEHKGLWFHTIGQRKGLGTATRRVTHEGPWYVAAKDLGSNTLVVTNKYHLVEAPRRAFDVEDINWIGGVPPALAGERVDLRVKTRHGPNIHDCVLEVRKEGASEGHVKLAGRDSGLAPGQWAAFYRGQECLGGGVIGEGSFMPSSETHEEDGSVLGCPLHNDQREHELIFTEDA
jgi:tRNA U34 2-thiouridine synthase MnmA/TrmU